MARSKATGQVDRAKKKQGQAEPFEEDSETFFVEEPFAVYDCDQPPAQVHVTYGLTINLRNFESARVDVGITVPCRPDEAAQTLKKAQEWVGERVKNEARRVKPRRN